MVFSTKKYSFVPKLLTFYHHICYNIKVFIYRSYAFVIPLIITDFYRNRR